jgi:predicted RNA binding protein YcfA (HicA-like mRNA interferase family)
MARRPIKTKDWIRFLEGHKCRYSRTTASHTMYKCPKCFRTIVFRAKSKEIPVIHLQTNLKTLGFTFEYLYDWLKNN